MKTNFQKDLTREQTEEVFGTYTTTIFCPNCGNEKKEEIPRGTSVYEMDIQCEICKVKTICMMPTASKGVMGRQY